MFRVYAMKSFIQKGGLASCCRQRIEVERGKGSRLSGVDLGSDQRLLLRLGGVVLLLGGLFVLQILLRRRREVGLLVRLGRGLRHRLGRGRSATQHLLGLGSVVAHVLLGDLGRLRRVLASDLSQLLGLRVHDIRGLLEMVVNELLVGGVNEGHDEKRGRAEEREAPVGHDLDQVVGKEGSNASLDAVSNSFLESGRPDVERGIRDVQQQRHRRSQRTLCAETR